MLCEIPVKVSFLKHTTTQQTPGLVEGDYNTSKLVFEFEEEVSGKRIVFKMGNSSGSIVMLKDLIDNEVVLVNYDEDGNACSLFNEPGVYPFELVAYGEDTKITSAPGYLNVAKRLIKVSDEVVSVYIPFFDEFIKEVDDLKVVKEEQIKTAVDEYLAQNLSSMHTWQGGSY